MSKPLPQIDNANVLYWAWSGLVPFGVLKYTTGEVASEIYGLAICQYANSTQVYRFSCDKDWETQQDSFYDSVQQAIEELPEQYRNVEAEWIKFE